MSKCFTSLLIAFFAFGLASSVGLAQPVRRQVQVSVPMKKSKPTVEEKETGLKAAKLALVREHIQSVDAARQANLQQILPQLEQQVDTVLSGVTLLGENVDPKAKTYTVALAADINESELNRLMGGNTASPATKKNLVSLVVVSRRQTTVKELGPKIATGTTELKAAKDSVDQEKGAGSTTVSQGSKIQAATVSESSVISSADIITYDVASSQEVDAAISGVMGTRGYKVVPADVLGDMTEGLFDKKKFIEDFKTGNDVAPETKRNAVKGCQKVEMPFFGYGTLTFGIKQKDDVSGKWKVNVSIIAEVWDVREKFPTKAAAVGPVQYQDIGDSQTQAENNALIGAANRAAQLVCDQLLQKGIR
jgi:hypothetical protein